MTIETFPSKHITPEQALLTVGNVEDIEQLAIVYMLKGEENPRLTCSDMMPVDMNFLGVALQHYSLRYLNTE